MRYNNNNNINNDNINNNSNAINIFYKLGSELESG